MTLWDFAVFHFREEAAASKADEALSNRINNGRQKARWRYSVLNSLDLRLEYDTAKARTTFEQIAKSHLPKLKADFEVLGPDAYTALASSTATIEGTQLTQKSPPADVVSAAVPGAAGASPAVARHPDLQILAVRATQLLIGRQKSGDTYTWQDRLGGGAQARVIRLSRGTDEFACKIVRESGANLEILREIQVYALAGAHPHLLRLRDVVRQAVKDGQTTPLPNPCP